MKNYKFLYSIIAVGLLFFSCAKDDEATPLPEPVNEEEVITTLTVTLTPPAGGNPITLQTKDLDGDGPNAPVVTVSGNLAADVAYTGVIKLLNETVSPAEDITEEVEEEDDEHQFFYTKGGDIKLETSNPNTDSNGNILGTTFTLTAGAASTGTLTFTLRHTPKKPNTGLSDAGGETDIEASFNITVE